MNITAAKHNIPVQAIFFVLLLLASLFTHFKLHPYGFDDAFIHFRVVRNFLETGFPYFNLNDPVKVSSSSGWIIFLSPVLFTLRILRIEDQFPLIVSLLNTLFSFSGMLIYTRIIHVLSESKSPSISSRAFQIAYIALLLPSSIGMMETPLGLLVAGAGIYCLLLSKRSGFTLLSLAVFIRAELVIVLFLASLNELYQRKFRLPGVLFFTGIGLMPFVIFDLFFYRTLRPHSIVAKSIVYSIDPLDTWSKIIQLSFPIKSILQADMPAFIVSLVFWIVLLYMIIKSILKDWASRRIPEHGLFFFWGVILISLYILQHVLIFEWYMPLYTVPLLVAATTAAIRGLASRSTVAVAVLCFLSLTSFYSLGKTFYASFDSPAEFSLFESGSRVKLYRSVAELIDSEYPNATLLTSEIGGIGFGFRGEILDAAGLASPEALKYHPLKIPGERQRGDIGAIPPRYVEVTLPGVIISYDVFCMALLTSEILENYNIIRIPAYLPEDAQFAKTDLIWGSQFLHVFIRKDLSVSEKLIALQIR